MNAPLKDVVLIVEGRIVRGQTALAKALGIRPQAVQQWRRVPADRVLDVEGLTGIPRHEMRPDIFGSSTAPDGYLHGVTP